MKTKNIPDFKIGAFYEVSLHGRKGQRPVDIHTISKVKTIYGSELVLEDIIALKDNNTSLSTKWYYDLNEEQMLDFRELSKKESLIYLI